MRAMQTDAATGTTRTYAKPLQEGLDLLHGLDRDGVLLARLLQELEHRRGHRLDPLPHCVAALGRQLLHTTTTINVTTSQTKDCHSVTRGLKLTLVNSS